MYFSAFLASSGTLSKFESVLAKIKDAEPDKHDAMSLLISPAPSKKLMARDIDLIIERVQEAHPQVQVKQLKVTHPADDDGIWFFTRPGFAFEVQLESSSGMCPFIIETNEHEGCTWAKTPDEAIETLELWLKLNS